METVREFVRGAKDFGTPLVRVVLVSGGKVKADHQDIALLERGTLFDSCLLVKDAYSVGATAILFVDEPFPIVGVDNFMSKRRSKWKSYTVERYGRVKVTLSNGEEITGRNFDELADRVR